jgi:hypothetical protein
MVCGRRGLKAEIEMSHGGGDGWERGSVYPLTGVLVGFW